MIKRLTIVCLLAICSTVAVARDYTATITWTPSQDAVDGYRVYQYVDGERVLLYEGSELLHETEINEPAVFGVVAHRDGLESDVVPRIAAVPLPKPKPLEFRVIVMPIDEE